MSRTRRRSSAAFCIRFSTNPSWLPRSTRLVSGSSTARQGKCFTSMSMPPSYPSMTTSVFPANTPITALSLSYSTAASQADTYRRQKLSASGASRSVDRACHAAMIRSRTSSCA